MDIDSEIREHFQLTRMRQMIFYEQNYEPMVSDGDEDDVSIIVPLYSLDGNKYNELDDVQ